MKLKNFEIGLALLIGTLTNVSAQNTAISDVSHTPSPSAVLDVYSTTKGILVPRLTETQKNIIASPDSGLLVYQTDASAGFWYYNGLQWLPFLTSENGWLTTGNNGIVDGTNFLGTLDDAPLTFRVGNEESGKISSINSSTYFGFKAGKNNTHAGSTFIGHLAGQSNTSGSGNCSVGLYALRDNTTGPNNTAIGYNSMPANTIGQDNSGLGENTLYNNTTGGLNTAIGSNALYTNISGNGNTACGQNVLYTSTGNNNSGFGVNSLRLCTTGIRNVASGYQSLNALTTGSNNTAAGYAAGSTVTTGSNNTFIGSGADANAVGLSNATALGYNAKVTTSNSMVLGGSGVSLVSIGVGVPSPTNTLSFDGTAARTIWMERTTTAAANGNSLTLQAGGAVLSGTDRNGGDLNLSSGTSTGSGSSNIYFKVATAAASGTADNAPTTKMTILGSGNVGIGTTTPATTLQVNGSVSVSYRAVSASSVTVSSSDYIVINTYTSGVSTFTLPTASTSTNRVIIIVNHGTSAITTSPAYRTANATTTTSVGIGLNVQLISDGTDWRKIN